MKKNVIIVIIGRYKYVFLATFLFLLLFFNLDFILCKDNNGFFYAEEGHKYYADEKYDIALVSYNKAMELGYMSTYMLNNLGFIYHYEEKEYLKAEQMYKKSLSINPENDWSHYYLSQLYLDMGELKEGIREYKEYVRYSNYKKTPINANKVRELLVREGKDEEDIRNYFREIFDINPNDYAVLYEIAEYDLGKKEYGEALEKYKKVIGLNSNMNMAYGRIGTCYYNLGKYQLSLEYFTKAKELGSPVPEEFFEILEEKISVRGIRGEKGSESF